MSRALAQVGGPERLAHMQARAAFRAGLGPPWRQAALIGPRAPRAIILFLRCWRDTASERPAGAWGSHCSAAARLAGQRRQP